MITHRNLRAHSVNTKLNTKVNSISYKVDSTGLTNIFSLAKVSTTCKFNSWPLLTFIGVATELDNPSAVNAITAIVSFTEDQSSLVNEILLNSVS